MTSDLQTVLQKMQSIDSEADLKVYCSTVDDLFLREELVMLDADWIMFNKAVSVKLALLSNQKS